MILIDTHVLIWVMNRDTHLGSKARTILEGKRLGEVLVSAITPWEVAMLDRKGRVPLGMDAVQWLKYALAHPLIRLIPLEPEISVESVRLPGDFHSDPADRIIVATARYLNVPLLTADGAIQAYAAQGYLTVIDASK